MTSHPSEPSLAEPCRSTPLEFTLDEAGKYIKIIARRNERNLDCCKDLYFGVFFDGTNNNAEENRPHNSHSNVARLYDTFPRGENAKEFISIYVPGVGTKFDAIGDRGEGDDLVWGQTDRRRGLAFAEKGEARIVYALLAILNNLHNYFVGGDLLKEDKFRKLSNDLTEANTPLWATAMNPALAFATQLFGKRQLIDNRRNEVLADLCREVTEKIAPMRKRTQKVLEIHLSVFGFSRGATEARVFSNWFVEMCGGSLCGIPVVFDFLGIFDTVASVGLANSSIVADGHMEWADAKKGLRIPGEIKSCLHLVAAHELRRSFPLDSVQVGRTSLDKCKEIVYPGVHSDVGGGYKPTEQGRGTHARGDDMLSRIPLAHMYRAARLANVPLGVDGKNKEKVTGQAAAAMTVAPATIAAFNAYLTECKVKSGTLAEILDEQTRLYVRWRRLRLESMAKLTSLQRAAPQDRTDLLEANRELAEEAKSLSSSLAPANLKPWDSPVVVLVKIGRRAGNAVDKRGIDAGHYEEWQRLKVDWSNPGQLPPAVGTLFEDYVHDSRAWFKPMGEDDHIWNRKQRERMQELEAREKYQNASGLEKVLGAAGVAFSGPYAANNALLLPLNASEKAALDDFRRTGSLPTQPTGREPFWMGGGYLRYRRVYYGSDAVIVAMTTGTGALSAAA